MGPERTEAQRRESKESLRDTIRLYTRAWAERDAKALRTEAKRQLVQVLDALHHWELRRALRRAVRALQLWRAARNMDRENRRDHHTAGGKL